MQTSTTLQIGVLSASAADARGRLVARLLACRVATLSAPRPRYLPGILSAEFKVL